MLEGLLYEAIGPTVAALVMHPHPQYGGDMDNHVVVAMRDALASAGAATLRFNLRGTGGSRGTFDPAFAPNDADAGLVALHTAQPDLPIVLAGYSYGAQLASGLAALKPPAALILVSPPLAYAPLTALPASLAILAIAGDADSVCPPDRLRTMTALGATVRVLPGVDHGWSKGTDALGSAIGSFADALRT